ncbi:MAG: bile acid:sodium symporter family protein [Flavobacteriaceae bacterium]|nr:bile acid:sodium symporter family protein [Flavobacteriaceae bacterium]MDH3795981.1 bile acid:sodium symporter family protein [Flavobacteriaceae bacterium]
MQADLNNVQMVLSTDTLWILNTALALIMFGVALNLKIADFARLLKQPKSVLAGVSSQFIMLPLVTLGLVYVLKPVPSIALGMFMVAACPGGVVSNFYSHLAKGNAALSISLTAIATPLAILMTPVILSLLGSSYHPTARLLQEISISPVEIGKVVGLLLGIPIIAGMFVHYKWPQFAQRIRSPFKIASVIFLVALIGFVIYGNRTIFMEYAVLVIGLVILHNFAALTTGFSWGQLWRLAAQDVRSLTIETGIQNCGLALLLILTFFQELGGMAVLAAIWGIWHLISGMLVASIWARFPVDKKAQV